ncbi:MAG: hypothetical protein KF871_10855 [Hydrogenophaga sp.]|uniref:hypothetical protein n=1 Tax=Hydrogenophaga sp. TaxID=1904254 RepID=UPI001D5BED40|nr:hypothetical protein [Hydrogenophaga sp.]MBX3610381.1 hypothetical protein [Hydrogenophaga sp.]
MALEDIKARCDEVGECWFWNGGCDSHGRPQKRHGGKTVYVRRLVRELADGQPVPPGLVVAAKCGHKRCVSPDCSVATTTRRKAQMAAKRGAYSSPAKAAKMARMKRAQSWITDEMVEQIRLAPGPSSRIAAETKVSLSHVKAIRRGSARRPIGTPFAGLGAR